MFLFKIKIKTKHKASNSIFYENILSFYKNTQIRIPILGREKLKIEYSTVYSQAVTHPSTNTAQHCLTSVIGRELVLSMWYGRIQEA